MTASRTLSARPVSKQIRCAIYTRVSTDQGLDQEFNSLDAQREASEAYIKSQAHEGWICLKQAFDDGGYSGGSIDRPALQMLLDEVRAKKIDVIVVYKVDRLTRSLTDFAKLVELFDAHEVSFVSVTQSFNTTSSMGRLTLNVLLSFAQFEREVTGERIRDKFAASKKKGMWMGGNIPLGYKLGDRRLVVHQEEAKTVRRIFSLYLELKSLPKLAVELAALGIVSRTRAYGGRTIGGEPFRTGALSHLLANRIYIGEVKHHDRHYPGEHEPIMDKEVFEAVQSGLSSRLNRKSTRSSKSGALLKGLLFDSNANRMTPVHANKKGVRYPYYQSWVLNHGQKNKAGIVGRVPAQEIEAKVLDGLRMQVGERLVPGSEPTDTLTLLDLIERVEVLEGEIRIRLRYNVDAPNELSDQSGAVIIVPWTKAPVKRVKQLIGKPVLDAKRRPTRAEMRSKLIISIAQARIWMGELISQKSLTIPDIARQHDLSERSIRSTLSLCFLAPKIVEAAIEGRLPRGLTVTQLTDLPANWDEQYRTLGFA